jgi:hypothetical protein
MRIKYILSICLMILVIGIGLIGYSIHKTNQERITFCVQASSLQDIKSCRYNSNMTYQQKYDMYYNKASKYYYDDFFYGGFKDAFDTCNTYKRECNLRDVSIYFNLEKKCAEDGEFSCSAFTLEQWDNTDKQYYIKILEKATLKNKNCPRISFFKHLSTNEKKSINPQVLKLCE